MITMMRAYVVPGFNRGTEALTPPSEAAAEESAAEEEAAARHEASLLGAILICYASSELSSRSRGKERGTHRTAPSLFAISILQRKRHFGSSSKTGLPGQRGAIEVVTEIGTKISISNIEGTEGHATHSTPLQGSLVGTTSRL